MRIAAACVLLLTTAMLVGCANASRVDLRPINTVEVDGLSVSVEIPKRNFNTGETFVATVTAENRTKMPIEIIARTGAPVYLRLWRHTGLTWQEVKRYPEAATMVMSPWTLAPGDRRVFVRQLLVEPDWPTAELLRLTAELNGRDEVAPALVIEIHPSARP